MLQTAIKYSLKAFAVLTLMMTSIAVQAQDKVEINTQEVKSWFETNWVLVVAGVVLLLLIVLVSRKSNPNNSRTINGGERKTTTVIKDAQGNVQSVTTTEEKI